jgi:hypothetical protein
MSRVEVSQNIGSAVVTSLSNVGQPKFGPIFNTGTYRIHSYQVLTTNIMGRTNVSFKVLGTNDDKKNWQVIARYNIKGANKGPLNEDGILYCDIWNFKYARVQFEGTFTGAESFKVLEKHNA